MCRKIFITLSVVVFILGITKLSFAQAHTEHEPGITETGKATVSEEAVNVGNKICPVMGTKIDEKNKLTYEHEGKIYNFCCLMCVEEFKKDPRKYIKKVDEELKADSEEKVKEETMMPESNSSGGMQGSGQHH